MSIRGVVVAGVYSVLVAFGGVVGGSAAPTGASPFARVEAPASRSAIAEQQLDALPVRSTRIERRDAVTGLQPAVAAVARGQAGSVWLAWTVPAVQRERHGSGARDPDRQRYAAGCVLDDDGHFQNGSSATDDITTLVVLARLSDGLIDRVTFTDARCTVQAGTRTVYWLDGVRPGDSIALLAEVVRRAGTGPRDADTSGHGRSGATDGANSGALAAIALTDDRSADRVLQGFVAPQVSSSLRRDAAFWLGAARGAEGARVIDRLSRTDREEAFREHLAFVLTLTGDAGLDRLIEMARHDESSRVRGQALFWVAQKAGERAVGTLGGAVDDDPDVEVRKRAVFAISQLPRDEGVPKLIALAGTHRDREVRQQAMFWLGQTGDPRALMFFEQVLGR
jgi:hypothetical protein